ncbi:MAG: CotH kinase family protein [Bacteriovoracaceae bacterium]|nr:CotH kinase family protein [Bacteriovoracaceae bacterium]
MKKLFITLLFFILQDFALASMNDFLPVVNTQILVSDQNFQLRVVSVSPKDIKINVLTSLKTEHFLIQGSPSVQESIFNLKIKNKDSKKLRLEAWSGERKLSFPQYYRAKNIALSKLKDTGHDSPKLHFDLIQIDYSNKSKRKIDDLVQKSLTQGYLSKNENSWIKGRVKFDQKSYEASLKLKGDLKAHWSEPNKSWKVKIPKLSKQINLTIAKDKYHAIQLLAHEMAQEHHLITQNYSLVQVEDLNLKTKGPALLDEGYSDNFFKENNIPKNVIYQPNNQWLITIANPQHPFANNYFNPTGPHPFLFDCIYYTPLFQNTIQMDFCDFLKSMKQNPQSALVKSDQEAIITWLALSTFFGDTHSFIHDNHLWYRNEIKKIYSPIPKDFIPLYPPFKNFEAYLNHAKLMHPLFQSILNQPSLKALYIQLLKALLTRVESPVLNAPLQYLKDKEKRDWIQIQTGLKSWHDVLLKALKEKR